MRLALLASLLLACGCASVPHDPAMPECSGGVCVFRQDRQTVRTMCLGFYGKMADGCWVPEIKTGWESAPILSPDICLESKDPARCRIELFGGGE